MPLTRFHGPKTIGEIPHDLEFIQPVHFRMETLASILPLLRPGDWTMSIDLSDAYHHVPIALPSRRLLGFYLRRQGASIQGSSLRASARAKAENPTGLNSGGLSNGKRHQTVLLSGRLADRRRQSTASCIARVLYTQGGTKSRVYSKLGEIFT